MGEERDGGEGKVSDLHSYLESLTERKAGWARVRLEMGPMLSRLSNTSNFKEESVGAANGTSPYTSSSSKSSHTHRDTSCDPLKKASAPTYPWSAPTRPSAREGASLPLNAQSKQRKVIPSLYVHKLHCTFHEAFLGVAEEHGVAQP